MAETQYLSLLRVIGLHDAAVDRSGDPFSPLVDPGKLESAISRPANAAYYEGADLVRQAVLLAVGISQSQAFLDGNKRAGFAAADAFLRLNGMAFTGEPMAIAVRLESVAEASGNAARQQQTDEFEGWLRGQVGPAESA